MGYPDHPISNVKYHNHPLFNVEYHNHLLSDVEYHNYPLMQIQRSRYVHKIVRLDRQIPWLRENHTYPYQIWDITILDEFRGRLFYMGYHNIR